MPMMNYVSYAFTSASDAGSATLKTFNYNAVQGKTTIIVPMRVNFGIFLNAASSAWILIPKINLYHGTSLLYYAYIGLGAEQVPVAQGQVRLYEVVKDLVAGIYRLDTNSTQPLVGYGTANSYTTRDLIYWKVTLTLSSASIYTFEMRMYDDPECTIPITSARSYTLSGSSLVNKITFTLDSAARTFATGDFGGLYIYPIQLTYTVSSVVGYRPTSNNSDIPTYIRSNFDSISNPFVLVSSKLDALLVDNPRTITTSPPSYGSRGSVGTGPTHDYTSVIDDMFKANIEALYGSLSSGYPGGTRSTNTGNIGQDAINATQNAVDDATREADKTAFWILQQFTKLGTPIIQALFKGIHDGLPTLMSDLIGWVARNTAPTLSEMKHFGDIMLYFINSLTSDLLDITDTTVEWTDYTEYWNILVETLDFDNDDSVSTYVIGISIGITALEPNTLKMPTEVHVGAIDTDVQLVDLIYLIWWIWKLPTWSVGLFVTIPVPLGLSYWALKDQRVPFSYIFASLGLQPYPAFHSGITNGFTFKDATLTWMCISILAKLADIIGLDKRFIVMILNKIVGRFKVGIKDITQRIKPPTASNKYDSSETTVYDIISTDLVDDLNALKTEVGATEIDPTTLNAKIDDLVSKVRGSVYF